MTTEKIAIISDIHGNIPALTAVLTDIKNRQIQRIFCLGDLIGKGPSGDKAVDIVQEVCEVVIQGNWDNFITNETNDETLLWHQDVLGKERLQYLKNLPFSFDFTLSGRNIRLFHASAKSVHHRVQAWDGFDELMSMFTNTEKTGYEIEAHVVGYGDVHYSYFQPIRDRIVFNTGSVGNPLDIPLGSYMIIEGTSETSLNSPFSIQNVRVPYDIDEAIRQAREVNMPQLEEYELELRTAKYRGLKE
ncbi:metallophosphoesterase [Bacillus sp. HMF5848]|uniref:metallophosphoesterase family protein n=1 Tax=Bacillus sp. HMF5848 TaxID=2495421 RepID=UPI000F7939A9|nr:metallophosphoesterase family protein [Bacillus sp. HMF5848]RSK26998.1 metallophosphoesterase [Bacillus sp. HMF5848]